MIQIVFTKPASVGDGSQLRIDNHLLLQHWLTTNNDNGYAQMALKSTGPSFQARAGCHYSTNMGTTWGNNGDSNFSPVSTADKTSTFANTAIYIRNDNYRYQYSIDSQEVSVGVWPGEAVHGEYRAVRAPHVHFAHSCLPHPPDNEGTESLWEYDHGAVFPYLV
jgi:hypothetical protein